MFRIVLLLLCLVVGSLACSQRVPDIWGASIHGGQVVLHSQMLKFDQPGMGFQGELECGFSRITPTGKYRQAGWVIQATNFGSPAVLGNAFIVTPTWQLPLNSYRRVSVSWMIGSGVGWATAPFDPVTNPTNNAVSAHLNNSALIGLRVRYALAPQWQLQHGLTLTHLSNATATVPNLGINMVSLSTGLRFKQAVDPRPLPLHTSPKRWQMMAYVGATAQESFNHGGYKSLLYGAAFQFGRRVYQGFWWLQTRYELPMVRYRLMVHFFDVPSGSPARQAAERWSVAAGREWLVGRFGLSCLMGTYIKAPDQPGWIPLYQILAGNFYLRPVNSAWQPFVGAQLKTHLSVAEYLLFVSGVRF